MMEYTGKEHEFPSPCGGGRVAVATSEDSACGKPHLNPPLEGEEIPGAGKMPAIKHYTRETVKRSRALRSNPTEAERKLWRHLRQGQVGGFKFRRQFFIGKYIVDFVCVEAKLVIEVDGSQHVESEKDIFRTRFIESHGYRVMRFWNNDVLNKTESVLESVYSTLTLTLSLEGRGDKKEAL